MKVKKLAKLVDRLQGWIDSMEGLFCAPVPNFEYGENAIIVRVGEFVVWNSLEDGGRPTFKECKKRFLEYVSQFENRKDPVCSKCYGKLDEETECVCPRCLNPLDPNSPHLCVECFQKFMSIGDEICEEPPSEPPSDDYAILQGHVEVRCIYFKDSGKYYSEGKSTFPADMFGGCVYPKDYGERLRKDDKLPGLEDGEWDGPFIVSIRSPGEERDYPELALPVPA